MITTTYEAKCDRCTLQISSPTWPQGWVYVSRYDNKHDIGSTQTLCAVCADYLHDWFLTPTRPYSAIEYEAYVGGRMEHWERELLAHNNPEEQ